MALLGNFDKGYTRTGDNFFTKLSNWSSMLPIPILSTWLVGTFGALGTGWEALGQLFSGNIGSAVTAVAAGSASTWVNATASAVPFSPLYWGNMISEVTTGVSAGTHARKVTEMAIGGVTGVVGMKPQILRSYPAGIGSIAGNDNDLAPTGQFVNNEAARRGMTADAYIASRNSPEMRQHVAELNAARSQSNDVGMAV